MHKIFDSNFILIIPASSKFISNTSKSFAKQTQKMCLSAQIARQTYYQQLLNCLKVENLVRNLNKYSAYAHKQNIIKLSIVYIFPLFSIDIPTIRVEHALYYQYILLIY